MKSMSKSFGYPLFHSCSQKEERKKEPKKERKKITTTKLHFILRQHEARSKKKLTISIFMLYWSKSNLNESIQVSAYHAAEERR